MKRLCWAALMLFTACGPKTEIAADNLVVSDANMVEAIDTDAETDTVAGWTFADQTDPITDERSYSAATRVIGQSHDLVVTMNCNLANGIPAFTVDGFDKDDEGASFAYGEAVQYRGDRSGAYQLTVNNTRFNNSRVLRPNMADLDSWMPFLGSNLMIRIPFSNGDATFDLSLDDQNFRSAMTPCVSRWKQLRTEQREAEREVERAAAAENLVRDTLEDGGDEAPVANDTLGPDDMM